MSQFALRLGATLPDFNMTCSGTTETSFHAYLDSSEEQTWTMLFTHPKDFTPVCTTELGTCHQLTPDFAKMGVKLIGLSCDGVESHEEWAKDVLAYAGCQESELAFPIIADSDRSIITQLGMLDPLEQDAVGLPLPARAVVIIGVKKEVLLTILYPATTGRDFNEVKRVIRSLKITENLSLATPANWKEGDRCIVAPGVKTEDAEKKFQNLKVEELPSGQEYMRWVDCPK